jgi:hypothetical protein
MQKTSTTLRAQSLHYFSRPHSRPRRSPLTSAAAWRGSDLAKHTDWRETLDAIQVSALDAGLEVARASKKKLHELTAADFPLPALDKDIARWRDEITHGRGFVVLRGVPVERWGREASELFFYALGLHLGIPGAQNTDGDLLGHVLDTGEKLETRTVRRYRTSANIAYHCDAADAVGLLCLRTAKSGGASRIVSSVTVYNELLARRPDLAMRLYAPFEMDTHGQNGLDYFPIAPCRHAGGQLRTFYHSDYFHSAQDYAGVTRWAEPERELIALYEELAASEELRLDMMFEPGDVQLVSNHTVLHARTEYEDHPEPERRRHLLRLWLSFPSPASLGERLLTLRSRAGLLASLARAKIRRKLRGPAALRG